MNTDTMPFSSVHDIPFHCPKCGSTKNFATLLCLQSHLILEHAYQNGRHYTSKRAEVLKSQLEAFQPLQSRIPSVDSLSNVPRKTIPDNPFTKVLKADVFHWQPWEYEFNVATSLQNPYSSSPQPFAPSPKTPLPNTGGPNVDKVVYQHSGDSVPYEDILSQFAPNIEDLRNRNKLRQLQNDLLSKDIKLAEHQKRFEMFQNAQKVLRNSESERLQLDLQLKEAHLQRARSDLEKVTVDAQNLRRENVETAREKEALCLQVEALQRDFARQQKEVAQKEMQLQNLSTYLNDAVENETEARGKLEEFITGLIDKEDRSRSKIKALKKEKKKLESTLNKTLELSLMHKSESSDACVTPVAEGSTPLQSSSRPRCSTKKVGRHRRSDSGVEDSPSTENLLSPRSSPRSYPLEQELNIDDNGILWDESDSSLSCVEGYQPASLRKLGSELNAVQGTSPQRRNPSPSISVVSSDSTISCEYPVRDIGDLDRKKLEKRKCPNPCTSEATGPNVMSRSQLNSDKNENKRGANQADKFQKHSIRDSRHSDPATPETFSEPKTNSQRNSEKQKAVFEKKNSPSQLNKNLLDAQQDSGISFGKHEKNKLEKDEKLSTKDSGVVNQKTTTDEKPRQGMIQEKQNTKSPEGNKSGHFNKKRNEKDDQVIVENGSASLSDDEVQDIFNESEKRKNGLFGRRQSNHSLKGDSGHTVGENHQRQRLEESLPGRNHNNYGKTRDSVPKEVTTVPKKSVRKPIVTDGTGTNQHAGSFMHGLHPEPNRTIEDKNFVKSDYSLNSRLPQENLKNISKSVVQPDVLSESESHVSVENWRDNSSGERYFEKELKVAKSKPNKDKPPKSPRCLKSQATAPPKPPRQFTNVSRLSDALFCVFEYLDTRTLLKMATICKLWRNVSRQPALWKRVSLKHGVMSSKFLVTISRWCTQMTCLTLQDLMPRRRYPKESPEEYESSVRGSLESGLDSLLRVSQDTLQTVALEDCGCLITERCLWLVSNYCRNLKSLCYVSDYDTVGPEVLWALGAGCDSIRRLDIHPLCPNQNPSKFTAQCVRQITQCWPFVEFLSVGGPSVDVASLTAVAKSCQNLRELHLWNVPKVTVQTIKSVLTSGGGLKSLHTLKMASTAVEPAALVLLADLCPALEVLDVHIIMKDYFPNSSNKNSKEFTVITNELKELKRKRLAGILLYKTG